MLNDFNIYLIDQITMPYLCRGQHTKLTPDNYVEIIHKREDGRGKYADGTTYAEASIAYCEKMFAEGYSELFAYDCSGLGVYWLTDLKRLWKSDVNANTMMGRCELKMEPPKRGWWVFRLTGNRATHIGYMVDDEYLIEAKGRAYGVVKTKFRAKDWGCWGIPNVFKDEIIDPPAPPVPPAEHYVEVVGGSVNVRTADSKKGKILFTAHKGDRFPFISTAPSGWYRIATKYPESYITNKTRYTELCTES